MINKIYHLADIHIRNYKRHKEYRKVFRQVFSYIKKTKEENDIIYVAGDLVHSKTDMSPELVNLLHFFLKGLADILPTIVIPGNHDLNLNNTHRLDALTPVIDAIGHPNIHFWKDNKVYEFNGVHFSHFSIFNNPSEWHLANEFEGDYKIALHHGPVRGAFTDINFQITNQVTTTDLFEGFDLSLLGDIHKRQFLDTEETICYPGSLIQQNFGETVEKGFVVWDLKTKKHQFIPIDNPHKFITLKAENNHIDIPDIDLKNARVRIKYANCDRSFIQQLERKLRTKHKIAEFTSLGMNNLHEDNQFQLQLVGSVRDIETQNKLISNFLTKSDIINDDDLEKVLQLNKEVNTENNKDQSDVRNIIWQPIKFEFDNIFSYGSNNSIDFRNIRGVYGLFAPNASGKSTLLDALMFCIFDKCSRTYKAAHVLNNSKDRFKCKLEFVLNGKRYFIKRVGIKGKQKYLQGRVKVNVDFWYVDENGKEVSLNGADRDETNKIIRSYLGTYDDFVLTTLSTQNDNQSFVDKSQKERKELLYNFLDISVFDKLYQITKDRIKANQVRLYDLSNIDYDEEVETLEEYIINQTSAKNKLQDILHQGKDKKKKLNSQIKKAFSKKKPINIQETSLLEITKHIESNTKLLDEITKTGKDLIVEKTELQKSINRLNIEIEKLQEHNIDKDSILGESYVLQQEINNLNIKNNSVKSKISHSKELVDKLNKHEYDPNCEYCVNNEFVIHATEAKELLPSLIEQKEKYDQEIEIKKNKLTKIDADREVFNKIDGLINDRKNLDFRIKQTDVLISQHKNDYLSTEKELTHWQKTLKDYNNGKEIIAHNEKLQKEIDDLTNQLNVMEREIETLYTRIGEYDSDIKLKEYELKSTLQKIKNFEDLKNKQRIFEYYLKAISRDGVPYKLLTETLPALQSEVNRILNQIVDFSLKLTTNEKNHINTYLVYNDDNGEDKGWPVELASGMERFMIATAIRSALVNVTSLPRPNFLAIDEGFGVLDSDKLNSVGFLFDYLKTQYSFLLCISHIDSMRDNMEGLIDIKKVNGFSKISV